MRVSVIALALAAVAACNDLRDFRGAWQGPRVGDTPALRVGVAEAARARLDVTALDTHGLSGTLTVDGVIDGAAVAPLPGAQADVLSGLTFDGDPLRVFISFVATSDGGGDATVLVALYDDERVQVRVLRGGAQPLYAIFDLAR